MVSPTLGTASTSLHPCPVAIDSHLMFNSNGIHWVVARAYSAPDLHKACMEVAWKQVSQSYRVAVIDRCSHQRQVAHLMSLVVMSDVSHAESCTANPCKPAMGAGAAACNTIKRIMHHRPTACHRYTCKLMHPECLNLWVSSNSTCSGMPCKGTPLQAVRRARSAGHRHHQRVDPVLSTTCSHCCQ